MRDYFQKSRNSRLMELTEADQNFVPLILKKIKSANKVNEITILSQRRKKNASKEVPKNPWQ